MVNVHEEVIIIDVKQDSTDQMPSIKLERLGSGSISGESVINFNDSVSNTLFMNFYNLSEIKFY